MVDYWERLIVALDLEDKRKINKVVSSLYPKGVKFKIGSIAFTKFGPSFVKELVAKGVDIFLDLKLHDIPNTMKRTAAVITEMECWAFTVHLQAGIEALCEVKKEVEGTARKYKIRKPMILGVTVLTSHEADLNSVIALAKIAYQAGIEGIIASPRESAMIKEQYNKLKVITPGIRSSSGNMGDQKRVTTAQYAFKQGKADYIVVGRPIIGQKDYLKAAEDILQDKL